MTRALFVQPHLDDVALSLGGTVALAAAAGDAPLIVTVFCAPPAPDAKLNPLARELHRRWGHPPDAVWQLRRDEDAAAARVLGARSQWLAYEDAIYRGYATIEALRGPPGAHDRPLARAIADELVARWRASSEASVYVPLGVGGHVDHRLCHTVGAALRAAGAQVRYYEEFPYVTVGDALAERLGEVEPLVAVTVDITATFAQRTAAIAAYASQLPVLFRADGPFPGPYEALLEHYARNVSETSGSYGERYWLAS